MSDIEGGRERGNKRGCGEKEGGGGGCERKGKQKRVFGMRGKNGGGGVEVTGKQERELERESDRQSHRQTNTKSEQALKQMPVT